MILVLESHVLQGSKRHINTVQLPCLYADSPHSPRQLIQSCIRLSLSRFIACRLMASLPVRTTQPQPHRKQACVLHGDSKRSASPHPPTYYKYIPVQIRAITTIHRLCFTSVMFRSPPPVHNNNHKSALVLFLLAKTDVTSMTRTRTSRPAPLWERLAKGCSYFWACVWM